MPSGLPASRRLSFATNVAGASLSPDGSRFAVATGSDAGVYDSASTLLLFSLPGPSAVRALRFSPTGDAIALAGAVGARADLERPGWKPAPHHLSERRRPHGPGLQPRRRLPPDPRRPGGHTHLEHRHLRRRDAVDRPVVEGRRRGLLARRSIRRDRGGGPHRRIFSLPDGTQQATLLGHSEALRSVAFSPDGTRVVTANADGTSRVWDVRIDRPEQPLGAHPAAAGGPATSPERNGARERRSRRVPPSLEPRDTSTACRDRCGCSARRRHLQRGRGDRRRRGGRWHDAALVREQSHAHPTVRPARSRSRAGTVT